jgi:uncharacterized membrane protein/2-hydroxychromene-2-carboxylate isomerase
VKQVDPGHRRWRATTALAILGALVCAYLEVLHVQTYLGLGGTGYCDAGAHLSCTSVALSGPSVVLGVPLPIWGLAGFVSLALASARRSRLLLPLAAVATAASLALLGYELLELGSICVWCEVVHVICFALLALAWRGRHETRAAPLRDTLLGEFAIPAMLVIVTAGFAPAYWVTASWATGERLPHGFDEHGRPWLGAEQPEQVVHEYVDYACPHCKIASSRMKMRLAADPGLRVVRHHQPRMQCGTEATTGHHCVFARAAICAGDQGRFWEMDDWLFHHARGRLDVEQASADVGLDLAEFVACLHSASASARAQADVDDARRRGIRGTPGYVIDDRKIAVDELPQLLGTH